MSDSSENGAATIFIIDDRGSIDTCDGIHRCLADGNICANLSDSFPGRVRVIERGDLSKLLGKMNGDGKCVVVATHGIDEVGKVVEDAGNKVKGILWLVNNSSNGCGVDGNQGQGNILMNVDRDPPDSISAKARELLVS